MTRPRSAIALSSTASARVLIKWKTSGWKNFLEWCGHIRLPSAS